MSAFPLHLITQVPDRVFRWFGVSGHGSAEEHGHGTTALGGVPGASQMHAALAATGTGGAATRLGGQIANGVSQQVSQAANAAGGSGGGASKLGRSGGDGVG